MRLSSLILAAVFLLLLYLGRDVVSANLGLSKVLKRERANGLHPELQLALDEWNGRFALMVISGGRNEQQQNELYAKGRTVSGAIVTDAEHAEDTAHGRFGAFDFAPAPNGLPVYDTDKPENRALWDEANAHFKKYAVDTRIVLGNGSIDWGHVQIHNWRMLAYPAPDYDLMYSKQVSA